MKKISCILLALLMLLLAACAPGTGEPEQTDVPDSTAAVTAGPEATYAPDHTFIKETDYDNRWGALFDCDIVETEDAYYLRQMSGGYLLYFDKAMGEGGYLCPKPECEHEAGGEDCNAWIGCEMTNLVFYKGRLWWLSTSRNGFGLYLYHMDPDGGNRTLVRDLSETSELFTYGGGRFCIHREGIYFVADRQTVRDGIFYNHAEMGYIPFERTVIGGVTVEAYDCYTILARDSLHSMQPMLRFAGEDVFLFISYDGVTEFEGEVVNDPEGGELIPDTSGIKNHDEILRWNTHMTEPETVYYEEDGGCLNLYYCSWVSQDGVPYFVDTRRLFPELDEDHETNPYGCRVFRVEEDGTKTEVLSTFDHGENFLFTITDGVLVTTGSDWESRSKGETEVWVQTIEGETLYKGPLPLEYRKEYGEELKGLWFSPCWATREKMVFCMHENTTDPKHPMRYFFVEYRITPDGLVETLLGESRITIANG